MSAYHGFGQRHALLKLGIDDHESKLKEYLPYLAGLGAAGVAGPVIYRNMRKVTPSINPLLNDLRTAAGEQFTRVIPEKPATNALQKALDRLKHTGGDPVIYSDIRGAGPKTPQDVKGLVRFHDPSERSLVRGQAEIGGAPEYKELLRSLGDKWEEYKYWRQHVPDAFGRSENIADIVKELGYRPGMTLSKKQEGEMLYKLRQRLKKAYPEGFLLKDTDGMQSGGVFPNEKTKFNTMLGRYRRSGLKAKYDTGLKKVNTPEGGSIGDLMASMDHPAFEGRVLDRVVREPHRVMVQAKLPIDNPETGLHKSLGTRVGIKPNREVRVHVEGGVAVPDLTAPRHDPLMYAFDKKHMHGATEYAQSLVDRLPPEHRNMSWAMDIVPLKGGGYNIIESNAGGESGFLDPRVLPLSGIKMRKAYMGNYAKPVARLTAALGATGAGLSAGLGTAGLAPAITRTVAQPPENPEISEGPAAPHATYA